MDLYLGELGDRVEAGFMQYTTRNRYIWVSGVLNSDHLKKEQVLQGPTAFYMPYLGNFNENVYIEVLTGSYVLYQ